MFNDFEEGSSSEVIPLGTTKCASLPDSVGFDESLECAIAETVSAHVIALVGLAYASTDLFLKVFPVAHGSNLSGRLSGISCPPSAPMRQIAGPACYRCYATQPGACRLEATRTAPYAHNGLMRSSFARALSGGFPQLRGRLSSRRSPYRRTDTASCAPIQATGSHSTTPELHCRPRRETHLRAGVSSRPRIPQRTTGGFRGRSGQQVHPGTSRAGRSPHGQSTRAKTSADRTPLPTAPLRD